MGLLSTLRRNWKKSLFGGLVLSYGAHYVQDYFQTQEYLRKCCEEARSYGHEPLPLNVNPRHLTVILNPAAKGRKAKDLFEKYCGPILYLAGFKVSIVQTEHIGQARSYMDIMENTDAIVIAGGDGTLGEVITGLLRRKDGMELASRLPIAVLPIGHHNDIANALFHSFTNHQAKLMAECALAVVRDTTRVCDVIQIDVLEEPDESGNVTPNKPVYAVGSLQWGAFRDADLRTEKYWYLGPMRRYATYFWGAFKDLTWNCSAYVKYTLPCAGCSKCRAPVVQAEAEPEKTVSKRWWQAFVPRPVIVPLPLPAAQEPEVDYSTVHNPECGEWHSTSVEAVEFNALSPLVRERRVTEELNIPALRVYTGPRDISVFEFMNEGFKRVWNGERFKFDDSDIFVQSLELHPVKKDELDLAERWYSIDNDNYEVRDIRLTLLPKKIRLFCAP